MRHRTRRVFLAFRARARATKTRRVLRERNVRRAREERERRDRERKEQERNERARKAREREERAARRRREVALNVRSHRARVAKVCRHVFRFLRLGSNFTPISPLFIFTSSPNWGLKAQGKTANCKRASEQGERGVKVFVESSRSNPSLSSLLLYRAAQLSGARFILTLEG